MEKGGDIRKGLNCGYLFEVLEGNLRSKIQTLSGLIGSKKGNSSATKALSHEGKT
jgi:hypothetical protein